MTRSAHAGGASRPTHHAPRRARATPVRELDLPTLRSYRNALDHDRRLMTSWARICTRRAAVLADGADLTAAPSLELLLAAVNAPVVADRAALIRRHAPRALPALPQAPGPWCAPSLTRRSQVAALRRTATALGRRVRAVDKLHAEATAALIAIYQRDPNACLDLLA